MAVKKKKGKGIKQIYYDLEDKYYNFFDSLDEKGIPVYSVVDPIENAGIPSFPLVVGILLMLVILLLYFLIASMLGPSAVKVSFSAYYEEEGRSQMLTNVQVTVSMEGKTIATSKTDTTGRTEPLEIPGGVQVTITASKPDLCEDYKEERSFDLDMEGYSLRMNCAPECERIEWLDHDTVVWLVKADGDTARNCKIWIYESQLESRAISTPVFAKHADGSFHIIDGSELCLDEDWWVTASCPEEGEFDGDTLGNVIKLEEIELETPDEEGPPIEPPDGDLPPEKMVIVRVEVSEKSTGSLLQGMEVAAVDSSGTPIGSSNSDVQSTDTTDENGLAELTLVEGTKFRLKVVDPGRTHKGETTDEKVAKEGMDLIRVSLETGATTTFKVTDSGTAGGAVSGADLRLYEDGFEGFVDSAVTEGNGEAKMALTYGRTYTVTVKKSGYRFHVKDLSSSDIGGTVEVRLVKLPDDEKGTVNLNLINSKTGQFFEQQVKVSLFKDDKYLYAQATVNDGIETFSQIEAGTYHFEVIPEGAKETQEFSAFTLEGKEVKDIYLRVNPAQAELTVITKVEGKLQNGVLVELWDADINDELIDSNETELAGRVIFHVDMGRNVYMVARYTDQGGEVYGPMVTESFRITKMKPEPIEIELKKVSLDADLAIEGLDEKKLKAGESYVAIITVGLTYYNKKAKDTYDEVAVHLYTGDPGSADDMKKTPVAIRDLMLADLQPASQTIHVKSILESSLYEGYEPSDSRYGKYLKVAIDDYKEEMNYQLRVPLHAKLFGSDVTKTALHVKAEWIEDEEVVTRDPTDGSWESTEYKLDTEDDGSMRCDDGTTSFCYKAMLSKDSAGSDAADPFEVNEDSKFYLQLEGMANEDVKEVEIPVKSQTGAGVFLKYSGEVKGDTVHSTDMDGEEGVTSYTVRIEKSMDAGERFKLTFELKAVAAKTDSIVAFSEELPYKVLEVDDPINPPEAPNVKLGMIPQTEFCYEPDCEYARYSVEEILPVSSGQRFLLEFTLENTGEGTATPSLYIKDAEDVDGTLVDFKSYRIGEGREVSDGISEDKTKISIPDISVGEGETMTVKVHGAGTSNFADGAFKIYISEDGTKELPYGDPVRTVQHGPIEYYIETWNLDNPEGEMTTEMKGLGAKVVKDHKVSGKTDVPTGEIDQMIAVLPTEHDPERSILAEAGEYKLKFGDDTQLHEGDLTIKSESDLYGKMHKTITLLERVFKFEPVKEKFPDIILSENPETGEVEPESRTVKMTNYKKVDIPFTVDAQQILSLENSGFDVSITGKPSQEDSGDVPENVLKEDGGVVPADGGTFEITVTLGVKDKKDAYETYEKSEKDGGILKRIIISPEKGDAKTYSFNVIYNDEPDPDCKLELAKVSGPTDIIGSEGSSEFVVKLSNPCGDYDLSVKAPTFSVDEKSTQQIRFDSVSTPGKLEPGASKEMTTAIRPEGEVRGDRFADFTATFQYDKVGIGAQEPVSTSATVKVKLTGAAGGFIVRETKDVGEIEMEIDVEQEGEYYDVVNACPSFTMNDKEGYGNHICDGEQFTAALLVLGNYMIQNDKKTMLDRLALGNNPLSQSDLEEITGEIYKKIDEFGLSNVKDESQGATSSSIDLLIPDGLGLDLECGVYDVKLQLVSGNTPPDVALASATPVDIKTPWCRPDEFGYALGLLNYNKQYGTGASTYGFAETGHESEFISLLEKTVPKVEGRRDEWVLGNYETPLEDRGIVKLAYYGVCDTGDTSERCAWMEGTDSGPNDFRAYYKVEGGEIMIGFTKSPQQTDQAKIDNWKESFISCLVKYWMTGESEVIPDIGDSGAGIHLAGTACPYDDADEDGVQGNCVIDASDFWNFRLKDLAGEAAARQKIEFEPVTGSTIKADSEIRVTLPDDFDTYTKATWKEESETGDGTDVVNLLGDDKLAVSEIEAEYGNLLEEQEYILHVEAEDDEGNTVSGEATYTYETEPGTDYPTYPFVYMLKHVIEGCYIATGTDKSLDFWADNYKNSPDVRDQWLFWDRDTDDREDLDIDPYTTHKESADHDEKSGGGGIYLVAHYTAEEDESGKQGIKECIPGPSDINFDGKTRVYPDELQKLLEKNRFIPTTCEQYGKEEIEIMIPSRAKVGLYWHEGISGYEWIMLNDGGQFFTGGIWSEGQENCGWTDIDSQKERFERLSPGNYKIGMRIVYDGAWRGDTMICAIHVESCDVYDYDGCLKKDVNLDCD
jgi:hypothetical protein